MRHANVRWRTVLKMSATVTTGTSPRAPRNIAVHRIKTITGSLISVQGDDERDFYISQATKYLTENTFTAASDFADLDRLVFMELLTFRATCWLGSGSNYLGEFLSSTEITDCRRTIKENSTLISNIKNDLGLTKAQRDKEQYESVGKYLTELKARAREHGIKREKELTKAICLIKELFAMLGAYDRSDEAERLVLGLENPEDILEWVRTRMKPEFDAIDDYFRNHDQKFWVRKI